MNVVLAYAVSENTVVAIARLDVVNFISIIKVVIDFTNDIESNYHLQLLFVFFHAYFQYLSDKFACVLNSECKLLL